MSGGLFFAWKSFVLENKEDSSRKKNRKVQEEMSVLFFYFFFGIEKKGEKTWLAVDWMKKQFLIIIILP